MNAEHGVDCPCAGCLGPTPGRNQGRRTEHFARYRARIVALLAEGLPRSAIIERLGVTRGLYENVVEEQRKERRG
jgi:hypothetical protein